MSRLISQPECIELRPRQGVIISVIPHQVSPGAYRVLLCLRGALEKCRDITIANPRAGVKVK
jgi:hypothetical protein